MSAMIYRLFNGDPFRSVSTSVPVRQIGRYGNEEVLKDLEN